jgi:8-oxo-dGTP diphosphatase
MTQLNKTEQDFLKTYNPDTFDKPSVTVDVVILTLKDKKLCALLTKRAKHPFKDQWSLPGGFMGLSESLDEAAKRVLEQKGKLKKVYLEQLYTFGSVKRDPRMRIISVSYYALTNASQLLDKDSLKLFKVHIPWQGETGGKVELLDEQNNKHDLAFDHKEIIGMAIKRIRGKLEYVPIGFELLPERFTLRQVQEVHETILGKKLNKDAFRRKLLASKLVQATGDFEQGQGFRPAEYYVYKGGEKQNANEKNA